MLFPKFAAAAALALVSVFVAGSAVRLSTIAGEADLLLSLALLATVVIFVVSLGGKSRRRDTRYW